MPEVGYILMAVGVVFAVTFTLRALPFALLAPLRESVFLRSLGWWMPAGVMVILAGVTLQKSAGESWEHLPHALVAGAVTVGVHLGCGRNTLVSVGAGTATFVGLVATF
ncbi:branched-chain amino acid transporter permease [Nesterenkonia xinjiangensis]|uniref:Branched-subunit amino acid transport protein AzlD n=1 Tax=Nesterenkonia xinjiangensis TaxID=225327 RepID=A0A7Z0GM12_9MICC|nr:AzlD domain-containing protein [Nesterenkonia xinjiangensis]NYJ78372.1 branched-subunit amino acid transport protein AzlD [Nesterenkonia xinjiangensis]